MDAAKEIWSVWFAIGTAFIAAALLAAIIHGYLRSKAPTRVYAYEKRVYLYRLPVRIWHWLNAALFIYLGITGFLGYFGVISRDGMETWHNVVTKQCLLALWIYMVIVNIVSGNGKHYKIKLNGLPRRCAAQAKYYLSGIFKKEEPPFHATESLKFNPIQQVTYAAVVYLMIPALIISGIFTFVAKSEIARHIHIAFSILSVIFLITHIYLCLCGAYITQYIKGMIDGYHRRSKSDNGV